MSKNEYNEFYLECISDTLNYALKEYPRITVIRVDLHFPPIIDNGDMPTCFPYLEGSPISRFTDSLKAKLKHDQHRKKLQGKRTFENNMRYMWVKEISTATLPHYHVFLVFNKDAYYHLGDYNLFEPSLRTMITTAWYNALQLEFDPSFDTGTLVHYPENCRYCLNKLSSSFSDDHQLVMKRLSYLAKEYSKQYSPVRRSLGRSQY
ncbi:TPA: inovirus Gp2 family protein [Proteus mirabilis]